MLILIILIVYQNFLFNFSFTIPNILHELQMHININVVPRPPSFPFSEYGQNNPLQSFSSHPSQEVHKVPKTG